MTPIENAIIRITIKHMMYRIRANMTALLYSCWLQALLHNQFYLVNYVKNNIADLPAFILKDFTHCILTGCFEYT